MGINNNRKKCGINTTSLLLIPTMKRLLMACMMYFRHELSSFKREIKAIKNPNKDLKKRHIVEWQSQLMAVELHLRRLGQLPTFELNINFADVSAANFCRATVSYHQPPKQGSVSFPPSQNVPIGQHQNNRRRNAQNNSGRNNQQSGSSDGGAQQSGQTSECRSLGPAHSVSTFVPGVGRNKLGLPDRDLAVTTLAIKEGFAKARELNEVYFPENLPVDYR